MRNRAKCKLCKDVIESFHVYDFVSCKCGEISIEGGTEKYKVFANDLSNILRVDDHDNEIIPKVVESNMPSDNGLSEITSEKEQLKPFTKKELLDQLNSMIENIGGLPEIAMGLPITHYDFASALLLLQAILKSQ